MMHGQRNIKFHLCNKINNCTCIKYVSSHVINYQHVSIVFATIIGVDLQEYKESAMWNIRNNSIL